MAENDDDPPTTQGKVESRSSYPIACPHCAAPQGYPHRVETSRASREHINIFMQCRGCQHTWMVQRLGLEQPPA